MFIILMIDFDTKIIHFLYYSTLAVIPTKRPLARNTNKKKLEILERYHTENYLATLVALLLVLALPYLISIVSKMKKYIILV